MTRFKYYNAIMLVFLIITLICFDFLLFIFGFTEMFNWKVADVIAVLQSVAPFITIVTSAMVALFVMRRNHQHSILLENEKAINERKRKQDDIVLADLMKQRKCEYLLNSITLTTKGYGTKIHTTFDLQRITMGHLLTELEVIIHACNEVRVMEFSEINDRQIENLKICDDLVVEAKNLQLSLITEKHLADPDYVRKKFISMYNHLFDYFEKSEYVKLPGNKLPMRLK